MVRPGSPPWRTRVLTVTGAVTIKLPNVAVMVAEPAATPVTRPVSSPLLPTVAIAALLDAQVALAVTSWGSEPSLKFAVTVKRSPR